jgi:hypothetical protein
MKRQSVVTLTAEQRVRAEQGERFEVRRARWDSVSPFDPGELVLVRNSDLLVRVLTVERDPTKPPRGEWVYHCVGAGTRYRVATGWQLRPLSAQCEPARV